MVLMYSSQTPLAIVFIVCRHATIDYFQGFLSFVPVVFQTNAFSVFAEAVGLGVGQCKSNILNGRRQFFRAGSVKAGVEYCLEA